MKRWTLFAAVAAAICVGLTAASATPAASKNSNRLEAYTAVVQADELAIIAELGIDETAQRRVADGIALDVILSRAQAKELRARGIDLKLTRVKGGLTVRQLAARQALNGFTVWRSYDEPGGIRDQLYAAARRNPQLVKLEVLGETGQGREIIAVKLTQGANEVPDGQRPAVLYSSTQHAREWISTEVNRRLMNHFITQWRANNRPVRKLLQKTELWFILVANPDGYQYTFDHERLWRKNLRDNNGDNETQVGDGVDPNRNFPNHWGWDEEGSSSVQSSDTYRGPAPLSEPETQAMVGLLDRIGFAFQVNWHSNGQWLLYAEGWQTGTPTADDPIYYAMSGNLDDPAIEDFHPGLSSDVLYVTNGETTDYAHAVTGALAWTPELSAGCPGCGFVFPDNDALVQEEFERNLPFAMSVAESAPDPANPKTVTGITTKPFYIDSDDPYKRSNPGTQLSFTKSYGDPQPVAVIAKRSLGAVTVKYRINGGAVQSAPTSEWEGGSRYDPASVYYHQMRGVVTGTNPGDSVEVWFEGGGEQSDSFTYQAVSESGRRVLVVAAEDYTGASPVQALNGPHFAATYTAALAANGQQADVYDIDAAGRLAPDALGVLSHYDAVIWETGNDLVTRTAGRAGGNADRLALDELLEFRSYMNEGGKVALAGDSAGQQYTNAAVGNQLYDPKGEIACNPLPAGMDSRRCLPLFGSFFGGDATNDVLQYYLGGYVAIANDGHDAGTAFDSLGVADPFMGLSWGLDDPVFAGNNFRRSSFLATSGILQPTPSGQFQQFESWAAARYNKPGGPFDPKSGTQYVYSQIADVSYKRLTREIAVPAAGGSLTFWTSYDTELHWDHLFVEARTPGEDDWTTLPDTNGHTSQDTGDSCPAGWRDLHPQLDHYQTLNADGTCSPTGSSGGAWHAASGNSSGWQQWSINLSAYAGETVEISIAYASDWAVQGIGVFVDDITLPDGTSTSFETGLDGWAIGEPAGSAPNSNNFVRTDASGFPVGNAIATPHSLLLGFGLEGVSTEAERNAVMDRVLEHLLD
jgi:Zinc carboxypeptidase